MKKIFISYCTKNKELAEAFIEFLQLGMGIAKSGYFLHGIFGNAGNRGQF